MRKITLVPKPLARKGYTFIYRGEDENCKECPVRGICHNLKRGRRYRVLEVREKEHDCAVHYGGKVKVVEYEELPQLVAIERKSAVEGAVVRLTGEECPVRWCKNFVYCNQSPFGPGQKVRIIELHEKLECHLDKKLILASVEFED